MDEDVGAAGEDAYGRASDPGRYPTLHVAMDSLLEHVEREYLVERFQGLELDPELVGRAPADRLVRLSPVGAGAPLTVVYTSFPGLVVRFGRWHVEAFPRCGCAACDEDVDDLAAELAERVEALVQGGLVESSSGSRRPTVAYRFAFVAGGHASGNEWSGEPQRRRRRPLELHWPAWRRRPDPIT